ncbi:subtilisin family serine protease [Mycetocola sp. BIGb0189]|uniref:S8 family peptidase n=1 Tax=Mycetocola sp. BIGb0189 TaxID=2940604 RepID=UPI0021689B74|nr:S8 family serine peptidase [Mycetocola sp. BIGb0189]MCS4276113.1 subtilisin family serine protease [Mycetocola sp. BIGb0189]
MAHYRRYTAALLAVVLVAGGAPLAFAQEGSPGPPPDARERLASAQAAVPDTPTQTTAGPAAGTAPVAVFVQLRGPSAFETFSTARGGDSARRTLDTRRDITERGRRLASDLGQTPLYITTDTLPGVALTASADQVERLRARDDVRKVTPIVTKKRATTAGPERLGGEPVRNSVTGATPYNAGTVRDTRAAAAWRETGRTGTDITIAVVDTGIDYTHADFGGPGTAEAFAQASAAEAPPAGLFDPAKFAGGYDFAGDSYDPSPDSPTFQPTPKPDANPLDCAEAGHGTHVAGTAAGYGIRADGTPQNAETDFAALSDEELATQRPGPGAAPRAKLLSYRVFGCAGSTDLVLQALDRVLDPNGDGNFDDRADIVNLSLGSDYAPVDDPENDMIAVLAREGVLPVIAAGNAGDLYDVGGSPGNAPAALTVANAIGSTLALDRAEILAPTPGETTGQYSADFAYAAADPEALTGTVVAGPSGDNSEGCEPFSTEDAARVAGNWVWLRWEDDVTARACGSAARFDAAAAAGARGVVLDSTRSSFDAGIAGNTTIPGIQLTRSSSEALRPSIGALRVRLSPEGRGTARGDSGLPGALAESSSRGPHGSIGVVKPNVAAPGTQIASAGAGSGTGVRVATGTSMSSPQVAGIAALVAEGTALRGSALKTAIVNTADTDLFRADNLFGPGRVGTGGVNALAAIRAHTTLSDSENAAGVSVEFGVSEIGAEPVVLERGITITNTGTTARTYDLSYRAATTVPGAEIEIPRSIRVGAGESARIPITLRIENPAALRKNIDATRDRSTWGVAWQYLSEVSGTVTASTRGEPPLRVAVHAAPKPTADLRAALGPIGPGESVSPLTLSGRELNQGTLGGDGYTSLIAPLQLGAESPRREDLDVRGDGADVPSVRALDLRAVGAGSTLPALRAAGGDLTTGTLSFGISTWGNWAALSPSSTIEVYVDSTGSGTEDYRVDVAFASVVSLDLPLARLTRLGETPEDDVIVDSQPVNVLDGSVDTNTFDNNVLVLPVSLDSLEIDPERVGSLRYRVVTSSPFWAPDGVAQPVDQTEALSFDPTSPDLWVDTATGEPGPLYPALTDTALRVHRGPGATAESRLLVLALHNPTGDLGAGGDGGARTQVLAIPETDPTSTPDPSGSGDPTTPGDPSPDLSASVAPPTASGGGELGRTGVPDWVPLLVGALLLAIAGAGIRIRHARRP